LFDTGGGLTVITPETAGILGCKPSGKIIAHRMSGEPVVFEKCGKGNLSIGEFKINTDLSVLDLMALLPKELPKLAGVISLHTFQDSRIILNLAKNELEVATPESLKAFTDNRPAFSFRMNRAAGGATLDVFVPVHTDGVTLWMLLDSGNLDTILLAPHSMQQLGMNQADSTSAPSALLSLPGIEPASYTVTQKTIIYDGALNAEFMERFVIALDFTTSQGWIKVLP
jgi:hypothetical protein